MDIPDDLRNKFKEIEAEYKKYTTPFQWHDAKWYFVVEGSWYGPYSDEDDARVVYRAVWQWQAAMDVN